MPKPRRVDRPVEKSISFPQSTVTQVDLLLWSELEECVPHGAWAKYIQGLIEVDLAARRKGLQGGVAELAMRAEKLA